MARVRSIHTIFCPLHPLLTCRSTAGLGVSRDDSWVAETAEVQAIAMVVVLQKNKNDYHRWYKSSCGAKSNNNAMGSFALKED